MLRDDYDCKVSVEKKISGRKSQWTWRQEKLFGGKPPIVK
jgi:hypothetical protein